MERKEKNEEKSKIKTLLTSFEKKIEVQRNDKLNSKIKEMILLMNI